MLESNADSFDLRHGPLHDLSFYLDWADLSSKPDSGLVCTEGLIPNNQKEETCRGLAKQSGSCWLKHHTALKHAPVNRKKNIQKYSSNGRV